MLAACNLPDQGTEVQSINEQIELKQSVSPAWYRRILKAAGNEAYASRYATAFRFRNATFNLVANAGNYAYVRTQLNSAGNTVIDSLTNKGIARYIDGSPTELTPKDSIALFEQVNSVAWFARLPHVLEEPAVRKDFLNLTGAGQNEVAFRVSFSQDGGGIDFKDSYVFWADTVKNELTKLAYVFYTGKGGVRLRELSEAEMCNGLWLGSWKNYGSPDTTLNLIELPARASRGELPLLSLIENYCIVQKVSADAPK